MTNSQFELLNYISGFDEGVTSEDVSEEFDIAVGTANKRLSILRKHDWAKRIRNEDNQFAHIITEKGLEELKQVGENPLKKGVKKMVVTDTDERDEATFNLPSDLLDTIEDIAQNENRDVDDVIEELLDAGLDILYEVEEPEAEKDQETA